AAARGSHRAEGRPSVRTPARGVPVATLASAEAPNRAERRRHRPPRRSAARMAQGAVAVGLALGVGGFAIAPAAVGGASLGAAGAATDAEPTAAPSPEATAATLSPAVVQERGAAVVSASSTAQAAGNAKADAIAASVPADATAALDTAVAELDTLIAATQAEQPALSALQPATGTTPAPVLSGDVLAQAVEQAGSSALADAAAADGAVTTSDEATAADDAAATASPSALPTDGAATADATAGPAEDADPTTVRLAAARDRVATLTAELQTVTQQTQEAAAAAAAAAEAARKEAQRTSLESYANGKIPSSALCELDFAPGQELRCDAAEALEQLNVAFTQAFGIPLAITDSYRSYGQQVACRAQKGNLCATPGTSNHGGGVAIDLGGNAYSFGTDQHDWMLAHAEEYGWTLPDWARATGSKPEPWHWEYVG
ncbi:D-alanyl-D-alanine carboxypeptidase family protein, partial [Cellulomonas sp. GbtcB1]|uniref:M15 family metallopeptidase n=1 Tax=Cellulomonas sp. GbtcB1 TaxID=2824746 RepID=UPI001C2F6A43